MIFAQRPASSGGQPACVNDAMRSHVERDMSVPDHTRAPLRVLRMLLPAALVALSSTGCATNDQVRYGEVVAAPGAYDAPAAAQAARQPMSLGEIVAALRAGRSPHELADEIDENGLLAPATSADIDLLLQSGADAELIDAVRDASSMSGRGAVAPSPPVTVVPPVTVSPPVVVAPPPLYPGYGWYPYGPYYAPFGFGFWYDDVPRYRPPRYRPDHPGPDRWRPGDGRPRPPAPPPNWQSPRLSPPPSGGPSVRPGDSPPGGGTSIRPGGSPRVSPGGSGGPAPGAVRDRRTID